MVKVELKIGKSSLSLISHPFYSHFVQTATQSQNKPLKKQHILSHQEDEEEEGWEKWGEDKNVEFEHFLVQ